MNDVKLKPCPFCYGMADIIRMGTARVSMIIACEDCGCRLETNETWIDDDCQWNRRPEFRSANRSFKIVGRHRSEDKQKSWDYGKSGTIAKKRVYTSYDDFIKYRDELIYRWVNYCNYDVEAYERIDGEWVVYEEDK